MRSWGTLLVSWFLCGLEIIIRVSSSRWSQKASPVGETPGYGGLNWWHLYFPIISTGTFQGMAGIKQTWLSLRPYVLSDWSLYSKDCLLHIPVTVTEEIFRPRKHTRPACWASWKCQGMNTSSRSSPWPTPRHVFSTVSQHPLLDKLTSCVSWSHCFTLLLVFSGIFFQINYFESNQSVCGETQTKITSQLGSPKPNSFPLSPHFPITMFVTISDDR